MNEEQENANQLENKVAKLSFKLYYDDIVTIAILMAQEVKDSINMYEGELNPKWKLWNDTIEVLKTRL